MVLRPFVLDFVEVAPAYWGGDVVSKERSYDAHTAATNNACGFEVGVCEVVHRLGLVRGSKVRWRWCVPNSFSAMYVSSEREKSGQSLISGQTLFVPSLLADTPTKRDRLSMVSQQSMVASFPSQNRIEAHRI